MSVSTSSNRRNAKSPLLLYLRMIFLMLVGLYTSRVVLATLGVSDYGIYNVVGGVVGMFTILSSSLSSAISRFLTFELGRGDTEKLKLTYCTAINVQAILAIVVVLIAEVAGVWFLNYYLNIPPDRLNAANWVLQCSIATFAVGLLTVPNNASIISHERMSVFAYLSILEAVLKLSVVFSLYISPFDKLKTYAVLLLAVAVLFWFIYAIYCKRHFVECTYHFIIHKPLLKEMTSFAGWNFLANAAWTFNTQGVNILINMYFGVTLNAARGVASQVESVVMQFVNNFMTALNPQITKTYAQNNLSQMHMLVCMGAKYSFFLVMFFAIPIWLETPEILALWLKIVPDYTVIFVRMTLLAAVCNVMANTLVTAQLSTGNIKRYQIVVTLWGLWVFPLTWAAFALGLSPVWAYIVYVFIYFILIFVRIYLVKDLIHLRWQTYVSQVLVRSAVVLVVSVIPPLALCWAMQPSIFRLALVCLLSFASSIIVIWALGMTNYERDRMGGLIKSKLHIA